VLFALLSLPPVSKAVSAATKITRKLLGALVPAVLVERIFVQASKITKRILTYLQGVFRCLGENPPTKTGAGRVPVASNKCISGPLRDAAARFRTFGL
jgi:hypothetical protein